MPPGNFAFLTPSVTPRPQNRPRKTGKLTPGKNPSTTGSAGRSDPARDACGRPRAFHLLFFHTFHHFWFLGNHSPGGKVESWRILRLRWRLFSGLGCFLFFLPNWALCGPNRPLTGLGRGVPPPGVETATRGLPRRRNPVLFRKEKTGTSYPRVSPGTSHGLFCHTGPPGGQTGGLWLVLWELALECFFRASAGRNARDAKFR